MHREAPFGSGSLAAAGVMVAVAQVFHPTLLGPLWAGATGAWLTILLAGLLAFLLFWPVALRVAAIPGGSLIGLARAAGGTPAAVLTALLTAGLLVWHCGLVLREASEMAVTAVYPHTPQTFAMVALVTAALYGAFGGIDAIVFLCRAFLPVLLLVILAILVGSFGWGEMRYLLPLWGPGPVPLVAGSVLVVALYTPMLFLLAAARRLRDRQRLWWTGLVVAGGAAVVYALAKVVLLTTFPYPLGRFTPFPLHAMARLVLGGRFLERIESLWLFFWVYATACHLAALLHTASALYAEAVGFPSHRTAVLPMVTAAGTLALLPPDIGQAIFWHIGSAPLAVAVAFGLPLLLALLAAARRGWQQGRLARRSRVVLLLLLVGLLSGCWDRTEIEDLAYLVALGVDRAGDGTLLVTAMVAVTPELTAGGVEAPVKPASPRLMARVLTARSETVTQALYILNGGLTRQLDMRQVRGVIVGEALAREGLEPLVMELMRSPWARGNILFAQARGRAHDVLVSLQPVTEVNPPKMVEGLLLLAKRLHLAPPLRLHHFIARYAVSGGDAYLPAIAVHPGITPGAQEPLGTPAESALPGQLPRGDGNPVDFVGTAVYRRDRLAGFLNVDQTQMLLALRGEMGKAYVTFPDPDHPERQVTMRFHQENLPLYRATLRDGRPQVAVSLFFEGELLAAPGGTNYVEPQARDRLEEAAAQYARVTLREVIEQMRGWESDPVGFGHLFRGRFTSWPEWAAFGWSQRVGQLEVEVEPVMRIRRYGLVLGPDRAGEER